MSIVATKWARRVNVPPTQKLVLLTLADFADDDGICWPSGRRIAEETGLSDRCIRYSMSEFRKHGLISGGGKSGSYQKITLNFGMISLSEEQLASLKLAASQRNKAAAASPKAAVPAREKAAAASAHPAAASIEPAAAADHIKTTKNHQEPPITTITPNPRKSTRSRNTRNRHRCGVQRILVGLSPQERQGPRPEGVRQGAEDHFRYRPACRRQGMAVRRAGQERRGLSPLCR